MSAQPRFTYAHGFLGLFFAAFLGIPFFVVAYTHKRQLIPDQLWVEAGVASALILGLLFYTASRCSTERMSYWYGLLVIASSVIAGTQSVALLIGFPILFVAVVLSVLFAAWGDVSGNKTFAAEKYLSLVKRIHANRAHQ